MPVRAIHRIAAERGSRCPLCAISRHSTRSFPGELRVFLSYRAPPYYRQTFTQTQYFLKSFQWHCCSVRQFVPCAPWAVAIWALEIAIPPATPIQKSKHNIRIYALLCIRGDTLPTSAPESGHHRQADSGTPIAALRWAFCKQPSFQLPCTESFPNVKVPVPLGLPSRNSPS
jgi:hypothetical protein